MVAFNRQVDPRYFQCAQHFRHSNEVVDSTATRLSLSHATTNPHAHRVVGRLCVEPFHWYHPRTSSTDASVRSVMAVKAKHLAAAMAHSPSLLRAGAECTATCRSALPNRPFEAPSDWSLRPTQSTGSNTVPIPAPTPGVPRQLQRRRMQKPRPSVFELDQCCGDDLSGSIVVSGGESDLSGIRPNRYSLSLSDLCVVCCQAGGWINASRTFEARTGRPSLFFVIPGGAVGRIV